MRRAPSRASSSSVSQVSPACREGVSMDSLSMGGVSFPPPPAGCLRVRSRERIRRLFSSPQVTPSTTFENNSSNAPNLHAAGALLIHLLRVVASAATPLRPDSPAYRSVKFSTDDSVYATTGDDIGGAAPGGDPGRRLYGRLLAAP